MAKKTEKALERRVQDALAKDIFFLAATEATDTGPLRAALAAHDGVAILPGAGIAGPALSALDSAIATLSRARPGIAAAAGDLIEPEGQILALRTFFGLAAQRIDAKGIKTFVDAGPMTAAEATRLKAAFPDAKIVFLVRDGRDIALDTWETMRRERPNPKAARLFADHARAVGYFWRRDWDILAALEKNHGKSVRIVRAENLRADPDTVLKAVLDFLRLGKSKAARQACVDAASRAIGAPGEQWWRRFDDDATRAFAHAADTALSGFGYPAHPPKDAPPDAVGARLPASALMPIHPPTPEPDAESKEADLRAAAEKNKQDSNAQFALGNFLWKHGRIGESLHFVQAALDANPKNYIAANVMTMALAKLGREKEAIAMGQRALETKDKAAVTFFAANSVFARLSANDVDKPFSEDRRRNVIAFSLWGDLPLYTEGAVANAEIARYLYPSWTCRYYHDDTVPKSILERLRARGAETILLPADQRGPHGGAWRFFVVDDTGIDRYICRDCDSRLNVQERLAVDDWIRSGKAIHIMRDHVWHNELILAGLWGGVQGTLPPIADLIRDGRWFSKNKWYDQFFLWGVVWPLMRERHLTHDTFYRLGNSRPFPGIGRMPSHAHVGGTVAVA